VQERAFWHFQVQVEQKEGAQVPPSSFATATAVASEAIDCCSIAALKTLVE
jgi:hypothetical protein